MRKPRQLPVYLLLARHSRSWSLNRSLSTPRSLWGSRMSSYALSVDRLGRAVSR